MTTDEALSWATEDKTSLLLQDRYLVVIKNDGTIFFQSGSSLSTAAAYGLADLLMFCSRMTNDDGTYLQGRATMHTELTKLSSNKWFSNI